MREDKKYGSFYDKLSVRNMRRSARDYLVYMLTMVLVTALMYAFSSLLFQNELERQFTMKLNGLMEIMVGLSTFFIILIVSWLINYMVRFMLEKRSTEFGIYLLLGMKKRAIARLYMRENILLGGLAFVIGAAAGILLQQVLMSVMCSMVRMEYHLRIMPDGGTLFMTLCCYGGCYLLALFRCRRKFKKMNIQALMSARRRNEEIKEKFERAKQMLLPLSVIFILLFWQLFGRLADTMQTTVFVVGLVITIYLFYMGLSAWIVCYVRRGGEAIYRGQNLFLLRQFASKVRTMQFTMGTLTSLFTLALLGASFALMFSDYEDTVLDGKFPFDVQIYSQEIGYDFAEEKKVIGEEAAVSSYYTYHIYTDGRNAGGTPDEAAIERTLRDEGGDGTYYTYDTYMGLTDYNRLREMLGYKRVELGQQEYLVQIKPRLEQEVQKIGEELAIGNAAGDGFLTCAGIWAEPFSQDGHNGADYMVVVPDEVLTRMRPYYTELVADLDGTAPFGLQLKLDELLPEEDPDAEGHLAGDLCCGSDTIISVAELCLVRDNLLPELKYMLASIILPLFYIGLVFVCVAVTVLSVQQVSDAARYRHRYDVLSKLGLSRTRIERLIFKQLAAFYLCPALLAVVISGRMILFASDRFIMMTGVPTVVGGFFGKSAGLFFGIYLVYFAVTYVEFKRSVEVSEQVPF